MYAYILLSSFEGTNQFLQKWNEFYAQHKIWIRCKSKPQFTSLLPSINISYHQIGHFWIKFLPTGTVRSGFFALNSCQCTKACQVGDVWGHLYQLQAEMLIAHPGVATVKMPPKMKGEFGCTPPFWVAQLGSANTSCTDWAGLKSSSSSAIKCTHFRPSWSTRKIHQGRSTRSQRKSSWGPDCQVQMQKA